VSEPTLILDVEEPLSARTQAPLLVTFPGGVQERGTLRFPFPQALLAVILNLLDLAQRFEDWTTQRILVDSVLEQSKNPEATIRALQRLGLVDNDGVIVADLHAVVGRLLGEHLLAIEAVQRGFEALIEAAVQVEEGELIWRFAHKAAHLAAVPWELSHYQGLPLLLSHGVVLGCTRVLTLKHLRPPPREENDRLRILLVTPHADMDNTARAFQETARRQLAEKLQGLVHLEELRTCTVDALGRRLDQKPAIDILDYFGHGTFQGGIGYLLLDGPDGRPDPVPATRLATLKWPPLNVLHGCQTAQTDLGRALSGVAQTAIASGAEAVLAMQLTVRMAATAFVVTPVLYEGITRGGSIQRAAAEVRRVLYRRERDGGSWYLPVLYLRHPGNHPCQLLARPAPPKNPFSGSGLFGPAGRFIGRDREIRQLWRWLEAGEAGEAENVSIVGKPGSGKSALLALIEKEVPTRPGMGNADVACLSLTATMGEEEARQALLEQVGESTWHAFQKRFGQKRLVLLLDDIGRLLDEEKAWQVRTWLRGLTQRKKEGGIQLVTSSLLPLSELFVRDGQAPRIKFCSALHNVLKRKIELGPFTKEEARDFIEAGLKGTGFTFEQFADLPLCSLPGDLKEACYNRFEELIRGRR
jgi:hypothetical protein